MTCLSPARPKIPSSVKLSTGRIVKKYQRLRARNSPLNDKVKRRLLAKLIECTFHLLGAGRSTAGYFLSASTSHDDTELVNGMTIQFVRG